MDNESFMTGRTGFTTLHFAVHCMQQRIAATFALVAFALCLLVGAQTGNPFSTTLLRALLALVGTYVVGSVLGLAAQKMLDENLKAEEEKLKILRTETTPGDR